MKFQQKAETNNPEADIPEPKIDQTMSTKKPVIPPRKRKKVKKGLPSKFLQNMQAMSGY